MLSLALQVIAFVLFLLAAFGVALAHLELVPLGLAAFVLSGLVNK